MMTEDPFVLFRPWLLLAGLAFALGFAAYLAIGVMSASPARQEPLSAPAAAAWAAASPDRA